jgi:nucleotide-binding universal stress UspA family protein
MRPLTSAGGDFLMNTILPVLHGVRAVLTRAYEARKLRHAQFLSNRLAAPELADLQSTSRHVMGTTAAGVKTILASIDGHAGPAAKRGAMLAELLQAELELMASRVTRLGLRTAAVISGTRTLGRDAIARLAQGDDSDLQRAPERTSISIGSIAQRVATQASESKADLVVADAGRRKLVARFFSQDLASEILRHCRRPLLFAATTPQSAYRHVLVAIDFSAAASDAARLAIALAPQARFTFVHAVRMQDEDVMLELGLPREIIRLFRKKACETGREKLQYLAARLGVAPQAVTHVVEHGSVEHVIASCARRTGADLVCVGKREQSWFKERLTGSVASRLLRMSRADLLVVPQRGTHDVAADEDTVLL